MKRTIVILAAAGTFSLMFTGCDQAVNTNANIRNTNANNAAVVVNATPMTNTNTNRWANTNVTREEYERSRSEYERDRGSSTIGQGANDSWLWFKTRAALLTTDDLRDSTINVDVVNDVVTLKGTVASAAQRTKAEQTAKGIEGVKSVKNELTVRADDSVANRVVNGNTNRR